MTTSRPLEAASAYRRASLRRMAASVRVEATPAVSTFTSAGPSAASARSRAGRSSPAG